MRTQTRKPASRGIIATASTTPITAGVQRLARHFKRQPDELAAELLDRAVIALEDALGNNCDIGDGTNVVFAAIHAEYRITRRFTITGLLDAMPLDELAEYQSEATTEGHPVQRIVAEYARFNVNLEHL